MRLFAAASRRYWLGILFALSVLTVSAKEHTAGDLVINLPDTMEVSGDKDIFLRAYDKGNNLIIVGRMLNLDGLDEKKVTAHADSIMFPPLRNARLIDSKDEPITDWTQNYIIRTYEVEPEIENQPGKAYTFHINANRARYIFMFYPLTAEGERMAQEMIPSSIQRKGWYNKAFWWWNILFMILVGVMLFSASEDAPYSFKFHLKWGLISLAVFAAIALYVTRMNPEYFWQPMLVAFILVVVTQPLRVPIGWLFFTILENIG